MKDRLLEFIKIKNLTIGGFAESIGVQSSSISHIISGRNKPSFDFIEKLLSKYPELNPRWFILGEDTMYISNPISHLDFQNDLFMEPGIADVKSKGVAPSVVNSKYIERIIIFYLDGTFKEYSNE